MEQANGNCRTPCAQDVFNHALEFFLSQRTLDLAIGQASFFDFDNLIVWHQ
jgi:hypothetical protein